MCARLTRVGHDQAEIWIPYESGSTIGQPESDDGVIILDEEYSESARITLERDCDGYGRPPIPYSIACGIYGTPGRFRQEPASTP